MMTHERAIRDALEAHLAGRGLKRTHQREQILEALLHADTHLTMEQITTRVRDAHPRIGQATIYRAIKLFQETGILHRHALRGALPHYELVAPRGAHHDHLVCTGCGRIVEFADPIIEARQEALAKKHGFRLESHVHVLRGVCAACG